MRERSNRRPAIVLVLLLGFVLSSPESAHAQERSGSDFLDGILQSIQDFKSASGRGLTRPGSKVAVDLSGLDTALSSLGLSRDYRASTLARKHATLRLADYRSVASCRAAPYGERCEFPAGVQTVRFFEPMRAGDDSVSFLMGVYERIPSNAKEYPGTGGVVLRVIAKREAQGWRIATARVHAAS